MSNKRAIPDDSYWNDDPTELTDEELETRIQFLNDQKKKRRAEEREVAQKTFDLIIENEFTKKIVEL